MTVALYSIAVIIVALLAYIALVIWRPHWGGFVLIALLPSYLLRTDIGGIPTTFLELALYAWLIVTLFQVLRKRKLKQSWHEIQARLGNMLLPVLVFFAAATVSVLIPDQLPAAAGAWKAWIFDALVFFILLLHYYQLPRDSKYFALALSVCVWLVAGWGLIELMGGFGMQIPGYINAMYQSANMAALILVPLWLLVAGYVLGRLLSLRGKEYSDVTQQSNNGRANRLPHSLAIARSFAMTDWFLLLTLLIGLVAIYFTRSYGGLLALLVGAALLVLWLPKEMKQLKKKLVLSGAVVFVLLVVGIATQGKLQRFINSDSYNSFETRQQIWTVTWDLIMQHPVAGIGFNNFEPEYYHRAFELYQPPLEWEVPKAHNLYLNLWAEMGLLGVVAFHIIFIIFFARIRNSIRTLDPNIRLLLLGTTTAMIALMVHGLLDTPYFKNDLSLLFWVIVSIPLITRAEKV